MISSRLWAFAVLATLVSVGCKKSDSPTPTAPSAPPGPSYNYQFVRAFGSAGSGPGQGNFEGIVVDSSRTVKVLFVSDILNNRVEKFDLDGNYLDQYTCATGCGGVFNQPQALALDSAGFLYVADKGNNRIIKLDQNGNFVATFGGPGGTLGLFSGPTGVSVDKSFNLWVSDYFNNRIQMRTPGGTWSARALNSPYGIVADSVGSRVYTVSATAAAVIRMGYDGSSPVTIGSYGTGNGQFQQPIGVALDPLGNLLALDSANERVQVFTPSGSFLARFGSGDLFLPGYLNLPFQLAVDSDRNIYIADYGLHLVSTFAPQ